MSQNRRQNKSGKRKPRAKRPRNRPNNSRLQITNIEVKPKLTRSMRYRGIFSSTAAITLDTDDMLCMLGFVNNTSTAFYPLFDSVKINSITINAYNTNGNLEDVTFSWLGTNVPDTREVLVVQQGLLARATYYPPEDSSSRWWMFYGTTPINLFRIRPSATTVEVVMDINFRCIAADGAITSNPLSVAAAITGLAARSLPNGSGFQFVPVDLATVT